MSETLPPRKNQNGPFAVPPPNRGPGYGSEAVYSSDFDPFKGPLRNPLIDVLLYFMIFLFVVGVPAVVFLASFATAITEAQKP